jgi:hypothetical protein
MRKVFVMALVVAVMGLSAVAERSQGGVIAGAVIEWLPGESIRIVNQQTDSNGVHFSLRDDTVYEGDVNAIHSGDRVTVWYRIVGERLPVADKVWVARERLNPTAIPSTP